MQETYSENTRKILQNKARLEKELKVKLVFKGKNILIEGESLSEYIAGKVIEAIDLGFTIERALLLKDEEFILEKIHIKQLTKRHDLERIRGRIIGTKGRTKQIIQELSGCFISLHDNTTGIIGRAEDIKKAMRAVELIVQGKKQSGVYSYLEKERSKDKMKLQEDLGIKEKP